jgi:hypothetical protein
MDYNTLLSYKTKLECQNLDINILNNLLKLFNIKKIKQKEIKNLNKIKNNTKINLKKNLNENKFLFFLNKINTNNINNIIIECLTKVKMEEKLYDYLYNKIIKDINFVESYVLFLLQLVPILKYKLNIEPTIFINKIHSNINHDDDNIRINNLKLILFLEKHHFFNNNIINYISDIIIKSEKSDDIYFWFTNNNITNYVNRIKLINFNNVRDKLLINSLFDNSNKNKIEIIEDKIQNTNKKDEFIILVKNILEEYKYLQIFDEIYYFIEEECKTNDKKKIFINYIQKSKDNNIKKLLQKLKFSKILKIT